MSPRKHPALRALMDQRGAASAEYALLIALVAVVAIAAATTLGTTIAAKFTSASNAINPPAASQRNPASRQATGTTLSGP